MLYSYYPVYLCTVSVTVTVYLHAYRMFQDTTERGRERQRATATLTTVQILQQLLRTVPLSRVSTSETAKWTGVGLHETEMLQKVASHRSKVESKILQET